MIGGPLVRQAQRGHELRGWRKHGKTFVQVTAIAMIAVSVGVLGAAAVAYNAHEFRASPEERTQQLLRKLAYDAFPAWQESQGDTSCPTIRDLLVWTDLPRDHVRDDWGQPIEVRCGEPLPGSVHGLRLRSAGPDGMFGTDDDVTP